MVALLPLNDCDDDPREILEDAVIEFGSVDMPETELPDLAELDPELAPGLDEEVASVPCPELELKRLSEDKTELLVLP